MLQYEWHPGQPLQHFDINPGTGMNPQQVENHVLPPPVNDNFLQEDQGANIPIQMGLNDQHKENIPNGNHPHGQNKNKETTTRENIKWTITDKNNNNKTTKHKHQRQRSNK